MQKIELYVALLVVLAIGLHLAGAGSLLLVLVFGMATLFFSFSGLRWFKSTADLEGSRLFSLLGGIGIATGLVFMLFKLMFWPYPGEMFYLPATLLAVVFVVSLAKMNDKQSGWFFRPMALRCAIAFVLVSAAFVVPDVALFSIRHRADAVYIEKYKLMKEHPENNTYARDFARYSMMKHGQDTTRLGE